MLRKSTAMFPIVRGYMLRSLRYSRDVWGQSIITLNSEFFYFQTKSVPPSFFKIRLHPCLGSITSLSHFTFFDFHCLLISVSRLFFFWHVNFHLCPARERGRCYELAAGTLPMAMAANSRHRVHRPMWNLPTVLGTQLLSTLDRFSRNWCPMSGKLLRVSWEAPHVSKHKGFCCCCCWFFLSFFGGAEHLQIAFRFWWPAWVEFASSVCWTPCRFLFWKSISF